MRRGKTRTLERMAASSAGYRIGFAVYWLIFAVLAIFMADNPGYVSHPERVPFPWAWLVFVWAILALLVAGFYCLLWPPAFRRSLWRLPVALVVAVALVATSFFTFVTDMPGLYYVPLYFSFVTMLIIAVISVVTGIRALLKMKSHAL